MARRQLLDRYSERALTRVWKAQSFSYWMTLLLHRRPDETGFDHKRQLGELNGLVNSRHGSAYLAEAHTAGRSSRIYVEQGGSDGWGGHRSPQCLADGTPTAPGCVG